jgi:hypothetical protein
VLLLKERTAGFLAPSPLLLFSSVVKKKLVTANCSAAAALRGEKN